MDSDRTERTDLAPRQTPRLTAMAAAWDQWAARTCAMKGRPITGGLVLNERNIAPHHNTMCDYPLCVPMADVRRPSTSISTEIASLIR